MVEVYIDSDVIVSAEIPGERNHDESKKFMESALAARGASFNYVTSIFAFLEIASAMIRRTKNKHKAYSLLYRVQKSWKTSIRPYPPIEPRELTSFTRLVDSLIETAIRFRTPAGDTIHAQTVQRYKSDYLVTWNKHHYEYMGKRMRKVKIVTPSEMLAELKAVPE